MKRSERKSHAIPCLSDFVSKTVSGESVDPSDIRERSRDCVEKIWACVECTGRVLRYFLLLRVMNTGKQGCTLSRGRPTSKTPPPHESPLDSKHHLHRMINERFLRYRRKENQDILRTIFS